MAFFLAPPIPAYGGVCVSAIRIGSMEPESLLVTMAGWTPLQLLRHWRDEVGALVSGRRSKAGLVTGLAVVDGTVVPSEWWTITASGDEVAIGYQVLTTLGTNTSWASPDAWWTHVDGPDGRASSWPATLPMLAEWCDFVDAVLRAADVAAEGD